MSNPITTELLTLIEIAIKQAVKTDPVAQRRLLALQGKVLQLQVTTPPLGLFILPVADGLEFTQQDTPADCQVKGSMVSLMEVAEDENRVFGAGVEIQGDQQFLVSLKKALAELDIDWEALLADRIGDLPAHQLARCLRSSNTYLRQSAELLADDLNDYLHEELRVAPSRVELKQFYQQVDDLRLRVDRLQARMALLAERSSASPSKD